MRNELFTLIEPNESLKSSILSMIAKKESRNATYKTVFGSVVTLISSFLIVFSVINIIKDTSQSGLSQYVSLIFSDGGLIASYWQTYVMSVAESLPILQITIVLASISAFIWSFNAILPALKNQKNFFYHRFV